MHILERQQHTAMAYGPDSMILICISRMQLLLLCALHSVRRRTNYRFRCCGRNGGHFIPNSGCHETQFCAASKSPARHRLRH